MRKTKSNSNSTQSSALNVISEGTFIKGAFNVKGDIRIDGSVKGNIVVENKIVIGESGEIDGDIVCKRMEVFGKVTGTIETSELLTLKSTSLVEGELKVKQLLTDEGAVFNGDCSMLTANESIVEMEKIKSKAS